MTDKIGGLCLFGKNQQAQHASYLPPKMASIKWSNLATLPVALNGRLPHPEGGGKATQILGTVA